MILVILGSQKFPFNRLLEAIDRLETDEEIIAQIGYSSYIPKHYEYVKSFDKDVFSKMMDKADIVITHGGTGSIINALKKEKKVIAVPRLAEYGEHIDNHQIQLVKQFEKDNYIFACWDMNIAGALETVRRNEYKKYCSNTEAFISDLEGYIGSI